LKNGTCPKCEYTGIYDGSRAAEGQLSVPRSVPLGTVSRALITDLVCGKCGYVESYVSDADTLADIAKRWPRVEASAGS
jgi:predicted nucleic-acid-binding Zn-ribbon protein